MQSNILALNAAVEAVRSKERGKGCAVAVNEPSELPLHKMPDEKSQ
jgi:methyl-accepting chemotaxis protein